MNKQPIPSPTPEPAPYPMAPAGTWSGEGTYLASGGRLVGVSPAVYLAAVRPLEMDEESRENVDLLKAHIQSGGVLDPLLIRADGREDGRHRAHAAHELGIRWVPVIAYGDRFAGAPAYEQVRWMGDTVIAHSDGTPLEVTHGVKVDHQDLENDMPSPRPF